MTSELSTRNLQLIQALQQALDEDRLILKYRPVMDLKNPDSPVFMLVCLMRTHSDHYITCDNLRKLCATTGLSLKLDHWLTIKGMKKIKSLRAANPLAKIFVPLSADSLQPGVFAQWLNQQRHLLRSTTDGLILGFRLSEISRNFQEANKCIQELRKLDVSIYLRRFQNKPVALMALKVIGTDYLEIPQKLLQTDSQAIEKIFNSCRELDVSVVLTGINSANEVNLDWSKGASMLSGNYILPLQEDLTFRFPATIS